MSYLFGVDIGGTKCAVVLGRAGNGVCSSKNNGSSMEILEKVKFSTDIQQSPEYTLHRIYDNIEFLIKKHVPSVDKISGIGVSCGGPLDDKRGIILSPPNLPGWDNIPIVNLLESKFNVRVGLQNDANACALAEWKFGAARGYNNVIFLTFGTGMGAGIILDGRLYSGASGMAGEIGHVRIEEHGPVGYGKEGSFEGFCSGGGITQLARVKVVEQLQKGNKVSFCQDINQLDVLNAKLVGDAAEAGDPLAQEIYRISGQKLGKGLSILIDLLNPEIIVIGSIFTRSRDLLWEGAYGVMSSECLPYSLKVCKVVEAELGESIGDYAALAVVAFKKSIQSI